MRKTFLPLITAGLLACAWQPVSAAVSDKQAFSTAYHQYQHLIEIGQTRKALDPARDAYKFGRKVFGPKSKNTAALAINYGQLAKGKEAQDAFAEAVKIYEGIYGTDAKELIDPLVGLARANMSYGKPDGGYQYYKRALKLADQYFGKYSLTAGIIRLDTGSAALSLAQSSEALHYIKDAQRIFKSLKGEDAELQLAKANFWLGKYYLAAEKRGMATHNLLDAVDTFDKTVPNAPITLTTHAFLVRAYEERGMHDEATKHCRAIGAAKPFDPNQDYLPVYYTQPTYPVRAQMSHHEGSVVVAVTVDANGFVKDPKVLSHEGDEAFEDAALDAVQKFRYVPRFVKGQSVATKDVKYKFTFKLAD